MKTRRVKFTVALTGYGFPFDMLRYDSAWPSTAEDAAKMETLHRDHVTEPGCPVALVLESDSVTAPSIERWNSFSCTVVHGADVSLAVRMMTEGYGRKR